MPGETQNQFSLTRATLSTGGRAKSDFLSVLLVTMVLGFAGQGIADSFTDVFSAGINTNFWFLRTNTALFTVTTNGGLIGFSKPSGAINGNLQYATLCSLLVARGNFDVRVDFTNASLPNTGSPGNQVQLNTRFGGQDFLMVRSDEQSFGQNAHVFPNPPGTVGMGVIGWTTNSGTLRVVRTGTLAQGFIDSTMSFQGNYNTNDATFSFVLQNNGTADAVSVAFGNFRLVADHIASLPVPLNISHSSPTNARVFWKDNSWPDFLRGYRLQTASTLLGTNPWSLAATQGTLSSNQFSVTNTTSGNARFFRLLQGP